MSEEQGDKPAVAGEPRTARIVIEVVAGLVPGQQPDPEFTRRYVIHSDEWHAAKDRAEADGGRALAALLTETNGKAQGYAAWLMLQPDRLNWVRTDWIYL